jgi:lambda family phage portal protein
VSRPWGRIRTPWHRRLWFDALATVSPARAHTSWHFDQMERNPDYRDAVHVAMRGMGYASAKSDGNRTPWPSSGMPRSADAEVLGDLAKLRERGRITGRDDPIGSGIVLQFVQAMVGQGIGDRSATGDQDMDAVINAVWGDLQKNLAPAEGCGWPALQRMLAERQLEDGEIWVRLVKRSPDERLALELVEGDRVSTPLDILAHLTPGHEVREGVERDRDGRIVAYWIAKSHPGDVAVPGLLSSSTLTRFIPLSVADFDRVTTDVAKHLRLPGRPGQSRSVTILHAVLQNLRDLDLLLEAAVKRVQVAACLAVFLETASEVPDVLAATAKKFHYQLDHDLVPGMIFVLRPGEKISTVNPNFPIPDLDVLVKVLARRIGAALGVSWRIILADLGEANFSAARADRIEFEESASTPRQLLIEVLEWARRAVLEDALLMGEERLVAAGVTSEDLAIAARWVRPVKPWLDPAAEAQGALTALQGKLKTLAEYCAEQGKDWEEHLEQLIVEEVRERELREEAGLAPAPAAPAAGTPPPAEDKPADQPPADDATPPARGRRRITKTTRLRARLRALRGGGLANVA